MLTVCNHIKSAGTGGKFVILVSATDAGDGVLVLSDFTRDFQHRDIVARWERGAGASVAASGLRIAGGGWWKMEGDTLVLYGQSAAYGRFDPDWLRQRLTPGTVLQERTVEVR